MKYSINRLLTEGSSCFLSTITPAADKISTLKSVRVIVRKALRESFQHLASSFEEKQGRMHYIETAETKFLSEELLKLSSEQKSSIHNLKPKFSSQGSFVYKTMNSPCQTPQQMDLDDGIYLPLDMFEDKPIVSKDLFFSFVDSTLKKLADANGWLFDGKKNTCSRVIVSHDIHVDVPLYAIPKERFEMMASSINEKSNLAMESYQDNADLYLQAEEVNLALRNAENWTVSDPKVISDWYLEHVGFHGEVLRRICRYLKAWRDFTFKDGGPSSIALMMCAVESFQIHTSKRKQRFTNKDESEALLCCVKDLPEQLRLGVRNLAQEQEEMMFPKSHMSDNEIDNIISAAEELSSEIDLALTGAVSNNEVISRCQQVFGNRIPNRPDLVEAIPLAATIRKQPAQTQPEPSVHNADAG
ncbi:MULTISPECIES: cyclic GMP-AMP synthase DncV-like nucleotidyltransferase [unclassified Pseudoalteromonas]|uniref:CBASS cGAMP synthase n=1 Tax=unclassified Pseudoalteromonas TaxID=194690 RepID=UPI0006933566|nr:MULTISPECIES: hypothetical protein [unclassified Pseudoalteromonas]